MDPYKVLGVAREATPDDIKKAFRKLAKEHHPDRNPGDAAAEKRFKEVSRAFEILSDPEKRAAYDEFGEVSLEPGFDAARARAFRSRPGRGGVYADGGFSMEDLLGELFGRGAPGGFAGFSDGGYARGFGGGFREGFSGGFGGSRAAEPGYTRALLRIDFRTAALGGERELRFEDGTIQKVRIPPGVRDGETLRLAGQGPLGGDLGLTLEVEPHPVFRREGEDLHIDLPITVSEAIRGGTVPVPTLTGTVDLKIPPGTQTGRTLRLRGKGVSRRGKTGDLYVHTQVRVPDRVDAAALASALDALAQAYSRDVREGLYQQAAA